MSELCIRVVCVWVLTKCIVSASKQERIVSFVFSTWARNRWIIGIKTLQFGTEAAHFPLIMKIWKCLSHPIYMMAIFCLRISFCIVWSEDLLPVAPSLPCSVRSGLHHFVLTSVKLLSASQIKGEHGVCGLEVEECVCVSRGPLEAPYAHRWFKSSACKGMQQTWRTHFDKQTAAYSDITAHTWINIINWARTCCLYRSVFKTNMSSWNTFMCQQVNAARWRPSDLYVQSPNLRLRLIL